MWPIRLEYGVGDRSGEPDGRAGDDQCGVLAAGDRVEPHGTRAYVAGNGGVSVINTANNQVITTVSTTAGDSYGIAVVQTGVNTHRVYVTNAANNTVRVINANTLINTYTAGASVQVGSTPRGIAVSADGTRAYVANWASNSVSVLNTTTATPTVVVRRSRWAPTRLGWRCRRTAPGFMCPTTAPPVCR